MSFRLSIEIFIYKRKDVVFGFLLDCFISVRSFFKSIKLFVCKQGSYPNSDRGGCSIPFNYTTSGNLLCLFIPPFTNFCLSCNWLKTRVLSYIDSIEDDLKFSASGSSGLDCALCDFSALRRV